MFAFAIWDAKRQRLLLARDRMGIKPLYWTSPAAGSSSDRRSRPSSRAAWCTPRPTSRAMPELLSTRYLSGRETLFKGIHRLLPGHTLVFENGIATTRQWWDVPVGKRRPSRAAVGRRRGRRVPDAARGRGAHAADGRRAARHVPVGRPRQQRHRRADGAA
jgi:asparagine synthetase B (glutamine-hydrolysing)